MPPSVNDTHCDGPGLGSERQWTWLYCVWRKYMSDYSKFEPLPPKQDLTGLNVIISGANSGIGKEAALVCAEWGASVVLACRDPPAHEQHPEATIDEIVKRTGAKRENLEWWEVDYGSLESVAKFAKRYVDSGRTLDLLFNNAGLAVDGNLKSKDGFELTHQINFLSHCLVTYHLLPSMRNAQAPRIINTVSIFHNGGVLDFNNFNDERKVGGGLHGLDYYCNSKLLFMNWTIELQERLSRSDEYRHLIVHGVHPGFVGTNIWRNPTIHALAWPLPQILTWIINLLAITPQQGSVGLLDAALNPAKGLSPAQIAAGPAPGVSALVGGKFYNRCRAATPRPETRDPLARARLFQRTFEDLKVKQRGLCAEIRAPAPGLQ